MSEFSKFSITTDIRTLLINNSGITELVNNNIYPVVAPENTVGDVILYYRDQYGKEYSKFGIYEENCKVFIAVVSENYNRSILITERINDIVEGKHFNSNGNEYECRLIDSTEDYEDKKYIQILLFEIK